MNATYYSERKLVVQKIGDKIYWIKVSIKKNERMEKERKAFNFFLRMLKQGKTIEKSIKEARKRYKEILIEYKIVPERCKYKSYIYIKEKPTLEIWIDKKDAP